MATTLSQVERGKLSRPWSRSQPLAKHFGWAVVGYNVLVIVWGAMVRATGSGAGCGNHWPLCNGQVIPVSPGIHTVIEFTHRAMTGGSTIAMLLLLLWTFRATPQRHAARLAAVVSTVLLLNEAFLGALLVKLGYVTGNQSVGRVVLLSVHLSNTLLLLGALTLTAVLLGTRLLRHDPGRSGAPSPERRRSTVLAVVALGSTLLVGVSGSLAALGDTLFPSASLRLAIAADLSSSAPALIRVRWVHPVSAVIAALCLLALLQRGWSRPETAKTARWMVWLLLAQFALGLADVLLLAPVWLQLVHLLGADLYWVTLVVLCVRSILAPEPLEVYPGRSPVDVERRPVLAT